MIVSLVIGGGDPIKLKAVPIQDKITYQYVTDEQQTIKGTQILNRIQPPCLKKLVVVGFLYNKVAAYGLLTLLYNYAGKPIYITFDKRPNEDYPMTDRNYYETYEVLPTSDACKLEETGKDSYQLTIDTVVVRRMPNAE